MCFCNNIRSKKIIEKLPKKRQSLFFSATMPKEIIELAGKIHGNPEKITIKPEQTTVEKVRQELYFMSKNNKTKLLVRLLNEKSFYSALIFTRTKHGADKIAKSLRKAGIKADAIHGNKS